MKISIKSFRRIKSAELETGKITIIAGKNENGKTSMVQGIAAALTGEAIPFEGLPKNQAVSLVHTGSPKAVVVVETATGVTGISYPDCKRVAEGVPPEISMYAAGMKSIVDEPIKSRPEIVAKILKSNPTEEQLFKALSEIGINPVGGKKIWETIEVSGWDGAHKQAQETGARYKGQWEEITGKRYGSKVASTYTPDEWEYDLATKTEAELTNVLAQEKEWLEQAIAHEAVSAQDSERTEEAKAELPKLEERQSGLTKELKSLRYGYKSTKTAMANIGSAAERPAIQKCPKCKADLMIKDGKIGEAQPVDESEIERNRKELDDCTKSLEIITSRAKEVEAELATVRAKIISCDTVLVKKETSQIRVFASAELSKTTEECRSLVSKAEARLRAFQTKCKADKVHSSVELNQKIVDVLSPTGLRLQVLTDAVKRFNTILGKISTLSGWGDIVLGADMSITHRGWPYFLISESAKWRCRVSLQVAIAAEIGDSMLLIDGADILDAEGKNQLLKLLSKIKPDSIVTMTLSDKARVPKIASLKGRAYWVNDGTTEAL